MKERCLYKFHVIVLVSIDFQTFLNNGKGKKNSFFTPSLYLPFLFFPWSHWRFQRHNSAMKMMKMPHSWLGMIKSKRQDIFGIARLLICHSDRSSLLQFCKYTEKKISEILLERTIDIYLSRWKGECYTYILDHCYHQFYIHAAKKLSSSARLTFAVIHWSLILCMADQKCHIYAI